MAEQRTVNPLVESSSLSPGATETPMRLGRDRGLTMQSRIEGVEVRSPRLNAAW